MSEKVLDWSEPDESLDLTNVNTEDFSCLSASELFESVKSSHDRNRLRAALDMANEQFAAAAADGLTDEANAYCGTSNRIADRLHTLNRTMRNTRSLSHRALTLSWQSLGYTK